MVTSLYWLQVWPTTRIEYIDFSSNWSKFKARTLVKKCVNSDHSVLFYRRWFSDESQLLRKEWTLVTVNSVLCLVITPYINHWSMINIWCNDEELTNTVSTRTLVLVRGNELVSLASVCWCGILQGDSLTRVQFTNELLSRTEHHIDIYYWVVFGQTV